METLNLKQLFEQKMLETETNKKAQIEAIEFNVNFEKQKYAKLQEVLEDLTKLFEEDGLIIEKVNTESVGCWKKCGLKYDENRRVRSFIRLVSNGKFKFVKSENVAKEKAEKMKNKYEKATNHKIQLSVNIFSLLSDSSTVLIDLFV